MYAAARTLDLTGGDDAAKPNVPYLSGILVEVNPVLTLSGYKMSFRSF